MWGSKKARFCESKAPSVITGAGCASDQRRPSGDLKHEQPVRLAGADDGLVAGLGGTGGVVVLENGRVPGIGFHLAEGLRSHDDVVGLRALELDQSQLRLPPVDAVVALGVAAEKRMRARCSTLPSLHRPDATPCNTSGTCRHPGTRCDSRCRCLPRQRRERARSPGAPDGGSRAGHLRRQTQ